MPRPTYPECRDHADFVNAVCYSERAWHRSLVEGAVRGPMDVADHAVCTVSVAHGAARSILGIKTPADVAAIVGHRAGVLAREASLIDRQRELIVRRPGVNAGRDRRGVAATCAKGTEVETCDVRMAFDRALEGHAGSRVGGPGEVLPR